jgi:hypothetical protein
MPLGVHIPQSLPGKGCVTDVRWTLPCPYAPSRIAARKCRAKKNALMSDLQGTLAGLVRKNEEYKLQVGGPVAQ